ncbi:M48 family metalloprotease [Vibrio mexicanus]|uniref:M48 family metalloprotease n=1 Tax=Vibrio mexicanus TaxID=1004326 RepID=UPI000ADB65B7|nr:M48 family metalloprotease [Vibrio mexicanus]
MSIDDAVIGVTQGALNTFNREEMQGVIAHEFSHILNGDMKLNTWLIGAIFGITCLAQTGESVLEGLSRSSRVRSSSSSDSSKAGIGIFALGLALYIIGWFGLLVSSMLKGAISRQREFLADASAVQFTRNDQGIARALIKIGSLPQSSMVKSRSSHEASHMMFGQSCFDGVNGWFATHPPLDERIKRIDPSWDGRFKVDAKKTPQSAKGSVAGFSAFTQTAPMNDVGSSNSNQLNPSELANAGREVIASIPPRLVDFARDPFSARFIPLFLMYDGSEEQKKRIFDKIPMGLVGQVGHLMDSTLAVHLRLPLLELAIPALKSLSESQIEQLLDALSNVADSDNQLSFSEWCVINLVEKLVLPPLGSIRGNRSLEQHKAQALIVLNTLAKCSHKDEHEASQSFEASTTELGWKGVDYRHEMADFSELKASLNLLVQLKPSGKERFLRACKLSIESDGKIETKEAELYRVIASFLEVPAPPLALH